MKKIILIFICCLCFSCSSKNSVEPIESKFDKLEIVYYKEGTYNNSYILKGYFNEHEYLITYSGREKEIIHSKNCPKCKK